MADGCSPATNRQAFQDFSGENKQGDDKSREDFTDRQSGHDGNRHGKLHRHAALHDIFVRFVEYWETTNKGTNYADTSDIRIPRAAKKPNGRGRRRDKQHAIDLPPIHRMAVVVLVFVTRMLYRHPFFAFVEKSCSFASCQLGLGQYFGTLKLIVKRTSDGFELSSNPPDATEEFCLPIGCTGQSI